MWYSNRMVAVSTAVVFLLSLGPAAQLSLGQDSHGDAASPEGVVLNKMHMANQVQIEMARSAMDKGQSTVVRRFGDRLLRDHRLGDRKVQSLAKSKGIQLKPVQMPTDAGQAQPAAAASATQPAEDDQAPATAPAIAPAADAAPAAATTPPKSPGSGDGADAKPDMQQQMMQMVQKLKQAEGLKFDNAYAMAMEKSHQRMVQTLQDALGKVQDPDVRGLIEKLIPILQQHVALAQDVQREVSAASAGGAK